ncbi:MAG TPA: O-antigen ligase family protein, partial [Thermodesulfovibrionales bacterium]|nr:O-antigen ligase family protein [Thermodesulfovibrionales bacterium]
LLTVVCLFFLFLSRGRINLARTLTALCSLLVVMFVVVWMAIPAVRQRILVNADEVYTVHGRTEIWQHYASAVRESPVVGWGYGDRIIWHDGSPRLLNKDMETEVPEQFRIGTHNTILFLLYHQGIIGLSAYLAFISAGCAAFAKSLRSADNGGLYVFSLFTVLVGSLFIHSAIESVPFAVPCIVFGLLSGRQQWEKAERRSACLP